MMKDKILFSVIVPIYNVQSYLPKCIDSILCQSFRDFELILVDDGSVDSSPLLCDEYGAKDARIKVVHKGNGGLSSARNAGLEVAKGKYVLFVDSDDLVLPSALDFIETCIKKYNVNCDFFLFKHQCGGEHVNIPFLPEVTVDEFLMNILLMLNLLN